MKFMILFAIWQFSLFLVVVLATKRLSNYKSKSVQDKKKIDKRIHIVAWVLGIAIPSAMWFWFVFLATF